MVNPGAAAGDYQRSLEAEGKRWGEHLEVERKQELHAWIDHPSILAHYKNLGLIDGLWWPQWLQKKFGGPAAVSLDLGCGSASRSFELWHAGSSRRIEGMDASVERIREAENQRMALGADGRFQVVDCNAAVLPHATYDLIFSAHSFHHFTELEHAYRQVLLALKPGGIFLLEEFVGPTQFQWTDAQIDATRTLMGLIPEKLRVFRWGAVKTWEGRPTVAEVVAASPFESIRSAEIVPLFRKFFEVVHEIPLGGTIQHLLYNGIVHNFTPGDPEAERCIRGVYETEDALIRSGLLPSDFKLLVGTARQ
jgi:SAM-dependent methyltransferase